MSCKNCFNGCNPVVGDKCVKYTGPSIPALEIENGDNLFSVVQILLNNTLTFLSGTGINVEVNAENLCALVTESLPECAECSGYNLKDILNALSKAVCDLNTKTDATNAVVESINAPINVGCIAGLNGSAGVNSVLQGTINFLCSLSDLVNNIAIDLETNYVRVDEVNTYINNFISGQNSKVKNKMVPYVAMEYYGPLTNFDGTGAGTGDWEDIYICNGNNNTPDRRGRTAVGALIGMGGGVLDDAVNPVLSVNTPNYALGSKQGANSVTLTTQQIPSHTHNASVSSTPDHVHGFGDFPVAVHNNTNADNQRLSTNSNIGSINITQTQPAGGHTHSVSNSETGGNQAHSNIQPSIAAYYIIYLP